MNCLSLIHVGEFGERFFADAYAEYTKRLSAFCRFTDIRIKEEKLADESSPALVARALEREGNAILAAVPKGFSLVSLCVEGKKLTSPELSRFLEGQTEKGGVAFVIGSSHGLADTVKQASVLKLSMSDMTFPHQLARVMLAEQLYRAFCISAGKNYHK